MSTSKSTLIESFAPADSSQTAPISAAQRALWLLQIAPDYRGCNITALFRVRGPLDLDSLVWAVRQVVVRHETLRTTFALDGGKPVQVISDRGGDKDLLLSSEDLRHLAPHGQERRIAKSVASERMRVFKLEHGPLFSLCVLRVQDLEHRWVIGMHPMVSDDWSLGVFVRDLESFYTERAFDIPAALPELPIQYGEYCVWQTRCHDRGAWAADLSWWRKELDGANFAMDLPADRPRPPVQSERVERLGFSLDRALMAALEKFGSDEGVAPFMALIGAFAALLHSYTGGTDIMIGTPAAIRPHRLHGLIGRFVNAVILRVEVNAHLSFRKLVQRVRRKWIAAFEHQHVPLGYLLDELGIDPDPSRSTPIQMMFRRHSEVLEPTGRSLRIERCELPTCASRLDLSLIVDEAPPAIRAVLEYNTDLFEPETIDRAVAHFKTLLASVLRSPDDPLEVACTLGEPETVYTPSGTLEQHVPQGQNAGPRKRSEIDHQE